MELENIFVILLFIVPGVLANQIKVAMDFPSKTTRSDAMELVFRIIDSLPIFMISLSITYLFWPADSMTVFMTYFDNMSFILTLSGIVLIFTVIYGFLGNLMARLSLWVTNIFRKNNHKLEIDNKDGWCSFFHTDDGHDYRYLKVIVNGMETCGFLEWSSFSTDTHEVVLDSPDYMCRIPEGMDLFPEAKLKKTYIDTESGLVVKEYSCDLFTEWYDSICI